MNCLRGLVLGCLALTAYGKFSMVPTDEILRYQIGTGSKAQRGFMLVDVKGRGFLLMKAEKADKGVHYQLPGGRIDLGDFEAENIPITDIPSKVPMEKMINVGKRAALRELWEETRIDLRGHLERLEYLDEVTQKIQKSKGKLRGSLPHSKIPRKLYYFLQLTPEEFVDQNITLSAEHIGYKIEPNLHQAALAAAKHSGGDSGRALKFFEEQLYKEHVIFE